MESNEKAEVSVEVETDEGVDVVENARRLEEGLERTLERAVLTTRAEEEGEGIVVNGDGWRFVARGEKVIFKPGGTPYRIVRNVDDLENVEEKDGGGVSFVFADEVITLRRCVEYGK